MTTPRYGRVNLSLAAILADDAGDPDSLPERVPLNGEAVIRPRLAPGGGEVGRGPGGDDEIQVPLPVPCQVFEGVLTHNGQPHVTLLVPTDAWYWEIAFRDFAIDDTPILVETFAFPVVELTNLQLADNGYLGTNIAPFASQAWAAPSLPAATERAAAQMAEILIDAQDAAAAVLTAKEAAESARATSVTKAGEASSSAAAAVTAKNEAVTARGVAVTKAGEASASAAAALTAKGDAESARATSVTKAGEASASAAAALTAKGDAESARGVAVTKAGEASSSAAAAATAKGEAGQSASDAATSKSAAEKAKGDTQFLYNLVETAISDFEADFDANMAAFAGIRDDINAVANTVAVDANRAEDAAQATEDALTVVRAHRWVPQGEWEATLAYSAGDVVAHDGGSYYAQQDIPAGVEPPGGEWMMLGGGGITDAAELTGALTQFVDASGAVVDLDGEGPELQAITLAEILSVLYQSLDSSVEASRVTGALTDQVDASSALFDWTALLGSESGHQTLVVGFASFAAMLGESFAGRSHKHPVTDLDATGRTSTNYLKGDGTWGTPLNTTYNVPAQSEIELGTATTARTISAATLKGAVQRWVTGAYGTAISAIGQALNKATTAAEARTAIGAEPAHWYGTQDQYDALTTKDPNVTYNILEG